MSQPWQRPAHDARSGSYCQAPRIVVAQAERANPLYRSYLKNFETFEPIHAEKTLASAIQIGNPVSVRKAIRTLKQFNGIVMDATEQELADAAALVIPPACSTARTRA